MTSTIKFYSLPKEFKDKNAIFDSNFETYLNRYNTFTISNFQYIKNQLRLSIKVSLNQDHAQPLFNQQEHIDYVRILNEGSLVEEIPYYYFVINQRWRGEETVELELEMDTLNTFKNQYTLSNKTLITREHKDRLRKASTTYQGYSFASRLINASNAFDREYLAKKASEMLKNGGYYFQFKITAVSGYGYVPLKIQYYKEDENGLLQLLGVDGIYDGTSSGIALNNSLRVMYNGGIHGLWIVDSLGASFHLICNLDDMEKQGIRVSFGLYPFDTQSTSISLSSTGYNYTYWIDGDIANRTIVENRLERIIDKLAEGINPTLFKKSEEYLFDNSGENNWYLIYANNNNVPTNQDDYVNPVNMFVVPDATYTYTSTSAVSKIVNARELSNFQNKKEVIVIRYKDGDSSNAPVITIGNTSYTLGDFGNTSSRYSAIAFIRGSNETMFDAVYGIKYTSTASGGYVETYALIRSNIEYFSVINVNYALFTSLNYGDNGELFALYWYRTSSNYYIGSGSSSETGTFTTISEMDFTQAQLLKCIALPYAPLEFLNQFAYTFDSFPSSIGIAKLVSSSSELTGTYMKLLNYNTDFDWVIDFGENSPYRALWISSTDAGFVLNPSSQQARNISRESKLYNSEFYSPRFVYDSFIFNFNLEFINIDNFFALDYKSFYVRYVVSKNLCSKFMFQFTQYLTDIAIDSYEDVLVISRNNEKALFNNEYVNYIRTGYNYDIKAKNRQVESAIVNTSIGLIGGTLQTALGSEFGIAQGIGTITGAISSIYNTINQTKAMDEQIARRMSSVANAKTSVSNIDDIDILEAYSKNKAKLCFYECSDIMKEQLYNLFFYFGYSTQRYGAIDSTSRLYFNFVQANIDYSYTNNIPSEILEDIKMKYGEGVIFMHYVDNDYDLSFQYENWETSLL